MEVRKRRAWRILLTGAGSKNSEAFSDFALKTWLAWKASREMSSSLTFILLRRNCAQRESKESSSGIISSGTLARRRSCTKRSQSIFALFRNEQKRIRQNY